ncbi:hypothetical protein [Corynebacterium matruchotii]|uniref:hypothetical protein n=1 Tax=Corynebacterium matruchotii TaxID=43768 RepID=UPI00360705F3
MPGFLLEYHRKSGEVHVEKFDSLKQAIQKRVALESNVTDDDTEIVVIVSPDEQMLRKSHSRYFAMS